MNSVKCQVCQGPIVIQDIGALDTLAVCPHCDEETYLVAEAGQYFASLPQRKATPKPKKKPTPKQNATKPPKAGAASAGNTYAKTSGWAMLFNVAGFLWLALALVPLFTGENGAGEWFLIGICSALSLFFFAALINMGANARWLLAEILEELYRKK